MQSEACERLGDLESEIGEYNEALKMYSTCMESEKEWNS